ncbi:MAG: sulfite exporter TauE/SafE family protein [Bacteroidetes bacterium]|nr:sulfite exporter TauE/SafE family protein [Bacteroidota bacterium]
MHLFVTIVIGAIIGVSSGMFGIGGALLATPLLNVWLLLPAKLALATPLPAAIPSSISGSIAYARNRLVRYQVGLRAVMVAMPMTVVGSYLTKVTPDVVLMVATGLTLLFVSWTFLRRGLRKDSELEALEALPERAFGMEAYLACAVAGFMSGFLAIGGGMVLVPAFVKILRLPMKSALATSLFCVALLALPGVVVHAMLEHIDWNVALILSIAVIPMSYLGARIATRLRNVTLERIYGGVMMLFAIYFITVHLLDL